MRTMRFQWLWERLLSVALYGMNMGPIDIKTNGEEFLLKKLARRLPKDAVLFDVGANKGEYTLALLEQFGREAKIFAFEPSIYTYGILNSIVPAHATLRLENIGFGEKVESVDLYYETEGSTLASVHKRDLSEYGIQHARHAETIRITRIDEYCRANNIRRINLLKLDVEGHELAVLKGCENLLSQKNIDVIQFEFGGCNVDSRVFLKDFYELLTPEYNLFRMVADGLVPLHTYRAVYEKYGTNNLVATYDPSLLS